MAYISRKFNNNLKTDQNRSSFFILVLILAALFFLYSLIGGNLAARPELIIVALIFCVLLFFCYLNLSAAFLSILFILPVLIGQDRYQIDIAPFLSRFISVKTLAINPFSLSCLFIGFLSITEIIRERATIVRVPLSFIIFIVTSISLVSFGFSQYGALGLVFELYFLTAFLAYFLGYYLLAGKEKYLKVILVMILSAVIPALAAVYQIITGAYYFENDSNLGRLSATFPHSNTFGSFLFVVLTLSLVVFFSVRLKKTRGTENIWKNDVWRYLPLMILFPLLILTFSRTAWISFFLGAIFVAYLVPVFRFPLAYGGSIGFFLAMFVEKIRERVVGIFERHMYDSMYGRMEIWDMALFEAQKRPITGFGIGSFSDIIKEVRGKETGNVYAHNDLLRFFLEGGIVLVLTYILYMAGAIYYATKSYFRYPQIKETVQVFGKEWEADFKRLGAIPVMLFGIMAVASLVEAPSMDFVYQIFAWTLLGSWLGTSQKYLNKHI